MRQFLLLLSLIAAVPLSAESVAGNFTPSAPVYDFRLPRFGENGYTEWVLRGTEGIYDGPEQIRVKGMALRIYSGDEKMAQELSLDSPEATILTQKNSAVSESAIEIIGANFKISGLGWNWDGNTKEIRVLAHTKVEFSQSIAASLTEVPAANSQVGGHTEIYSESLLLRTGELGYAFEFTKDVRVVSDEMDLTSQTLIVLADGPEGRDAKMKAPDASATKLEAVRQVIARGDVVIKQDQHTVRAGEADFFPREQASTLTGLPQVELPGAFISGATIRTREGRVLITGDPAAGRAQMILTQTGGLGIQGASSLSEETIVLADKILMHELETENKFIFEDNVDVMSGALQLKSDTLTVLARKAADAAATDKDEDSSLKVGEVHDMLAEGSVRIEQDGQIVNAEKVRFFPLEERAHLTGSPTVSNGESVISGKTIDLVPGKAIVNGTASERVVVVLPVMPDLGYKPNFVPSTVSGETAEVVDDVEESETIVKSRIVEMLEDPKQTRFIFKEDVEVLGTNLKTTCDRLEVTALQGESGPEAGQLDVEIIEAIDNVVIHQGERVATTEKAIILPKEGKMTLEGNAVVKDPQGTVKGHKVILFQGERRAVVEGGGPTGDGRARITIPAPPSK